jgi:hypothetical protein
VHGDPRKLHLLMRHQQTPPLFVRAAGHPGL